MPGAIELPRTIEKLKIRPYVMKTTTLILTVVQSVERSRPRRRRSRRSSARRRRVASSPFSGIAGGRQVRTRGAGGVVVGGWSSAAGLAAPAVVGIVLAPVSADGRAGGG